MLSSVTYMYNQKTPPSGACPLILFLPFSRSEEQLSHHYESSHVWHIVTSVRNELPLPTFTFQAWLPKLLCTLSACLGFDATNLTFQRTLPYREQRKPRVSEVLSEFVFWHVYCLSRTLEPIVPW